MIVHQNQDFSFARTRIFSLQLVAVSTKLQKFKKENKKRFFKFFKQNHTLDEFVGQQRVKLTLGVDTFKSSRRNESRIRSCSAERITVVGVVAFAFDVEGGITVEGDHTLPDSIFSNVGTIRLTKKNTENLLKLKS